MLRAGRPTGVGACGKSLEAWASPRREDHPGLCGTWAAWTLCPSGRQLARLERRESTPRGLRAWPTVGTPGPACMWQLRLAGYSSQEPSQAPGRLFSGNSQAPGGGPRLCSHEVHTHAGSREASSPLNVPFCPSPADRPLALPSLARQRR